MNILLVGNAGNFMRLMINRLNKEGHRVFVLTEEPKKGYSLKKDSGVLCSGTYEYTDELYRFKERQVCLSFFGECFWRWKRTVYDRG